MVIVKVKGRNAVHESSGLQDSGHIPEDGKSMCNTTLNMFDLSTKIMEVNKEVVPKKKNINDAGSQLAPPLGELMKMLFNAYSGHPPSKPGIEDLERQCNGIPLKFCHVEHGRVSFFSFNRVLEQHLVCAVVEHSLSFLHDEIYFGPGIKKAIMALKSKGYLIADPSRDSPNRIWSYIGHEKMPSRNVSIRAIETEKYKVIDKQKNEVLEEIEESKAFFQVYDGAVYMHQGKTYLVKELDISSKIALCQVADLKYYTKTRDYTDVHVIGGKIAYPARISNIQLSRTTSQVNTCKVTTTWFGFYRIWRGSNQIFDAVDLLLPTYSYESQAVWIRVPQSIKAAVEIKNLSFRAGLHAADHALLNVIPLYIICNSSDLASECVNPHDSRYVPERILLYDQHPGGTGISAQVQPIFTELLTAALELLTSCCCSADTGCPNCVQNLACHEYNEVLHKDAAIIIIKGVLDAEKSHFDELS